ncbi:hypothetical protein F4809DRAFT_628438 [Biscogniauxia mediterranea]|nr:hypothetical protein F4809DRAFT_628438 [Biscogniauxia mediterranea]
MSLIILLTECWVSIEAINSLQLVCLVFISSFVATNTHICLTNTIGTPYARAGDGADRGDTLVVCTHDVCVVLLTLINRCSVLCCVKMGNITPYIGWIYV